MITHTSPRRWRFNNYIQTRVRELPTEAFILGNRVLSKFITGANTPLHGRLHAKVFRGDQGLLDGRKRGWKLDRIIGDGAILLNTQFNRRIQLSKQELKNHGIGHVEDLGCVGCHLITTAGKNYLAGCFPNTNEPENIKYHGFGTGTNAANVTDVSLQTELTTQYAVDNTRPTGSQSTTNAVYTTVGTLVPDSGGTIAVTEWGIFSASSSTTLFDRQVFSAVNLVASADSLATTYALTIA